MTNFIVEKSPGEKFKVGLYYWPPDVDETNAIVGASAVASPAGLTLVGSPAVSGQQVMQMITGGTAGVEYLIQFTVTTTDGSIYNSPDHDAIRVRVI